jgi:molybdopterin molybdotransferase
MSQRIELSVEEAQKAVLGAIEGPLPAVELPVGDVLDRVLASELHARWALPGAPLSVMDGYAVRAADLATDRGRLKLVGESAAGHAATTRLEEGQAMRISTGAVVPDGADAVVPQEEAEVEEDGAPGRRLVRFGGDALAETSAGRYVRPIGSDVQNGELLLRAGTSLDVGDLALLAGAGHARVPVHRAPRVAVLGTGDELVPIGATPKHGQIISTNGMMLANQIRQAGGVPVVLPDAGDDDDQLRRALERGLECDLLVTTGGISVGDHDRVFPNLEKLGVRPIFRRLKLRPGRPTTFGLVDDKLVLALPGNPASSHVTFELLARPLIRKWIGLPEDGWLRPRIVVKLGGTFEGSRRRAHYVRARREGDTAVPLDRQLSGSLRSISSHDLLVIVAEGVRALGPGDTAPALVMRD